MTGRGAPQFPLRFPEVAMRAEIKAAAKAAGRTMNAEIIHRLQAFKAPMSISIEVDTGPILTATAACERLTAAAEEAFRACEKLGIRRGVA